MEETKVPKVQRLAAELRAKIREGVYPPGSALPKVRELQESEGVAYQTARDVYRVLEDEGLIISRRVKARSSHRSSGRSTGTGRAATSSRLGKRPARGARSRLRSPGSG